MPCILSGPSFDSFPSRLEQFIRVSPDCPAGDSKSLVFYVYFEDPGIDYAMEDGVSYGNSCEYDDSFRRGKVRVERKTGTIAPSLI